MKEFESIFGLDWLGRGLRKSATNPRNTPGLVDCHNLMPTAESSKLHEQLVDMNASGTSWGGVGKLTAATATRTITINVNDFVTGLDLETASVYLDDVLQGTTDANGDISIADVTVGIHTLKITKTGYIDSDADDIPFNDSIAVT